LFAVGAVVTALPHPRRRPADPANSTLGYRQVQRWNLPEGWVIS
jgi:hypothetical protein